MLKPTRNLFKLLLKKQIEFDTGHWRPNHTSFVAEYRVSRDLEYLRVTILLNGGFEVRYFQKDGDGLEMCSAVLDYKEDGRVISKGLTGHQDKLDVNLVKQLFSKVEDHAMKRYEGFVSYLS